ncbi:uncharacterized protein LOC109828202 [Asparagus officinalis]|uniref:uncharacterized protein LOC109828202 n=1 Tax=Asparagus officinalis TaxID=4686 RepID=UPI00098E5988|nr:uncharacterized protein LOC109828202 [Asparagus officinalis]
MSPKKTRGSKGKSAAPAPGDVEAAVPSFGVPFPSVAFSDREDPGQSGTLHASFNGDFLVREARQFSENRDNSIPELVREGGRRTLRALLTDSPLTPTRDSTEPLKKTDYLFGDSVEDPDKLCRGSEIWLNEHEGSFLFLPPFPRQYSLLQLRNLAVSREMTWHLTEDHEHVHCGYIGKDISAPGSVGRPDVRGLHPGIFGPDGGPQNELMIRANTVKNKLARVGRELPIPRFRCYGWVHSLPDKWWARMTKYVLHRWDQELRDLGLYAPIRASMHGLPVSADHFMALFESYIPETNTFLTKYGELGLPLHEMMKVSGLPLGNTPYQEYFPNNRQLMKMKKACSPAYDILWELTCHYQIAIAKIEVKSKKAARVSLKQFADYLFQNLESPTGEEVCESPILTPSDVNQLITKINAQSYRTESSEGGFLKGTKFNTFLWQATKRMKPATLLSGYLAIWLKRCVVPHQSSEALPLEVLFPAVQLVVRGRLSLLSAMIADLHSGLRNLANTFTKVGAEPSTKIPLSSVEFPYTYLMAWLVLHRSDMMSAPDASDPEIPLLQLLEGCKWLYPSRPWTDRVRQFKNAKCWEFYKCFPRFSGAYNDTLVDEEMPGANRTSLDTGSFHWLMNIRPGYNVFRSKNICRIEPYFPCRFARQFGYDQLYIGNPNKWLINCGGLIDGVRAWFWNVAGCTGARFSLPVAEPGLYLTFLYCRWILAANTPLAKKKLHELESEAVVRRIVSKKGKEPATSSRKGKQVADSEESDDFETSSEEDETRGDAEGDVPLSPVAHRTRRASSPKLPGAPSKGIQMKEKNIPLSSSNKMTLRWLSQEGEAEEEEEEVAPLINRKRSRLTAPSEVQPQPTQGTELRTKFRHESSEVPRDSRASKRIKKTAHRERQLSPLFEEKFTQDLPVDERVESEEEGEIVPKPSSPGLMDVDESSFTEQVHKAMNEEPLHMDIVPPPATTSTSPTADTVKLKEVSAGSSAANPATIVEDITVDEPGDIELTHDMGIGDFDERDFDLDISEDVHQEISDILSNPVPSATAGPTTRVDSAEADASKDVGPTNEVDASTVIGECDQPEGLGFLLLASPPAEVEPPVTAPPTSAIVEAEPVVLSAPTLVDHEVGGSKDTAGEQPPAASTQLELVPQDFVALDPKPSGVSGEQPSPIVTQPTIVIPEQIPVVIESALTSTSQAISSSLSERIQVLLADEDPDKAALCVDVQSFVHFLNAMVDRILLKGSPFELFRKSLDRHVSGIKEQGCTELSNSIEAYLVDLKQHIEQLQNFRVDGAPSYIASEMDLRLQAWRDSQKSAESELQTLKTRIDQLRVSAAKKAQIKVDLYRDLESRRTEVAQLEKRLAEAKDACEFLESDLAEVTQAEVDILRQLNFQNKTFDDKEQEVARIQSIDERKFKAKLIPELELAYATKLSKLEDEFRHYKLL